MLRGVSVKMFIAKRKRPFSRTRGKHPGLIMTPNARVLLSKRIEKY